MALELFVAWEAWGNERHDSAADADNTSEPDHPDVLRFGRILTAAVYVTVIDYCFAFKPSIEGDTKNHPGYLILFGLLTALPPAYFFFEAVYLHGKKFGKNENHLTSLL